MEHNTYLQPTQTHPNYENKTYHAASCNAGILRLREIHPVAYSVPTAQFTIKGRVTDSSGSPIEGISIKPSEVWQYNPDNQDSYQDNLYQYTQGSTDANGLFEVSNSCFAFSNYRVLFRIEDVDGEQNGGLFESRDVKVDIEPEDQISRGAWTTTYLKEVGDIIITKEEE